MSIKKIGIGIVGLGTVGSGLIEIIQKNNNIYKNKYKMHFSINGISAKNRNKKRNVSIKGYKWFDDPVKMTELPNIDIINPGIGAVLRPIMSSQPRDIDQEVIQSVDCVGDFPNSGER